VSDTPQVIAQMRQLGLNQPVTSYSVAYNPKLIEQLGKAADGVIATSLASGAADSPKVAEYVERWKKEVGREPNGLPYTNICTMRATLLRQSSNPWRRKRSR
jgi:branched-chain amino acid transport system substrate-binding protein